MLVRPGLFAGWKQWKLDAGSVDKGVVYVLGPSRVQGLGFRARFSTFRHIACFST